MKNFLFLQALENIASAGIEEFLSKNSLTAKAFLQGNHAHHLEVDDDCDPVVELYYKDKLVGSLEVCFVFEESGGQMTTLVIYDASGQECFDDTEVSNYPWQTGVSDQDFEYHFTQNLVDKIYKYVEQKS